MRLREKASGWWLAVLVAGSGAGRRGGGGGAATAHLGLLTLDSLSISTMRFWLPSCADVSTAVMMSKSSWGLLITTWWHHRRRHSRCLGENKDKGEGLISRGLRASLKY